MLYICMCVDTIISCFSKANILFMFRQWTR